MNFSIYSLKKFLPSVKSPLYRQPFTTRLKWTGIALGLYLLLANISVIGLSPVSFEQFRFLEIILGSRFGTIMTLGIGPIVTAGIIMQLLVGSKILNWNMRDTTNRKKFQFWNKLLAFILAFVEAAAFTLSGALPVISESFIPIVILQLAMGGIIVILLDDLVSKWGFGSGISLFIVGGVASQIFIRLFSPLAATCTAWQIETCIPSEFNPPTGLIWNTLISASLGRFTETLISLIPIISTIFIFILVAYLQSIKIEVPLAFSALRGFGRTWGLKLLYTSNIPVIFAGALLANIQLMGRMSITSTQAGISCGLLGCFDTLGNPVSGLVYYLSIPIQGLVLNFVSGFIVPAEILRAIIYTLFLTTFATIFSVFWVNTAGMDAKSIAEQLEGVGMQIPGYRRDPRIIESVLNRYIPALAVLGGFIVGLIASLADILGAVGTGTGILLTVMILYNYYEELKAQNLEEAPKVVRKILGEE